MDTDIRRIRNSLVYDILVALLYAWCVFQAISYDAKTRTSGILIYVVVYAGFTLLVRSPIGVLIMNILSAMTLQWIFASPVVNQAAGYFKFGTWMLLGTTLLASMIQALVAVSLMAWGQPFLMRKSQYKISAGIAVAFTICLTVLTSLVPAQPV